MRTLRQWNGRWQNGQTIFIAAYSQQDAVKLIEELCGWPALTLHELQKYFSSCWGNSMNEIKPERGAWVTKSYGDIPQRLERQ